MTTGADWRRRALVSSALALGAGGLLAMVAGTRRPGVAGTHGPAADGPPGEVCIVAPPTPYDPASGLGRLAARPVPADARCPVCGMFAARHARWAAMAVFSDGAAQFFDTPVHLFLYLQQPTRYQRAHTLQDVAALYVADHHSGHWLPADQAVFVHGSRVPGPMRTDDLPAFASPAAAQAFMAGAGGSPALAAELRQALPGNLQALAPHRH